MLISATCGIGRASSWFDNWEWRNPASQGNSLRDLVWWNGQFVAAGKLGVVLRSTNGTDWSVAQLSRELSFSKVFALPSEVILANADGRLVSSTNGMAAADWKLHAGPFDRVPIAMAKGGGLYVAAAENGVLSVSSDLEAWTETLSLPLYHWSAITYAFGEYVAVGSWTTHPGNTNYELGVIASSPDGMVWSFATNRPNPISFFLPIPFPPLKSVAFGAGILTTGSLVSSNGADWGPTPWTYSDIGAITYLDGRFTGFGTGYIGQSIDGINWSTNSTGNAPYLGLGSFAKGLGTYAAVGGLGYPGRIGFSTNGQNWSVIGARPYHYLQRFVGGQLFRGGNLMLGISANGISWQTNATVNGQPWATRTEISPGTISSIAYQNGLYVAGGAVRDRPTRSFMIVSTNGLDWRGSTNQFDFGALAVAAGDGKFVAVGHFAYAYLDLGGTSLLSLDGFNWQSVDSGTTNILRSVVSGPGNLVAVGDQGNIVVSTNGSNWTQVISGASNRLNAVTWGSGVFMAAGIQGTMLRSTNGIDWNGVDLGTTLNFNAVDYKGSLFLASANDGYQSEAIVYVSADGLNWRAHPTAMETTINSFALFDGRFVGLGDDGTMVETGLIPKPLFSPLSRLPGGGWRVAFTGADELIYHVESSSDLLNWSPWTSASPTNGFVRLVDLSSAPVRRFYRAGVK